MGKLRATRGGTAFAGTGLPEILLLVIIVCALAALGVWLVLRGY